MPQQSPDTRPPRSTPKAGEAPRKGNRAPGSSSGRSRIQVRASGVHGRGVYALADIRAGERIIEYKGERIDWDEALRRHPHDPAQPDHTFFFHLEEGGVIDAAVDGNNARWINHACSPNCEAREEEGRVFIHALTDISPGEELFYDYGLIIDERYTAKVKKRFECRCGSPSCRGTMLAPKR
jgi:SET domain-containing protein